MTWKRRTLPDSYSFEGRVNEVCLLLVSRQARIWQVDKESRRFHTKVAARAKSQGQGLF